MKDNRKFSLIAETVDEMHIGPKSIAHNYCHYGLLLNRATEVRKISIFNDFEKPKYTTFTPFPYQWDAVDLMLNKFEGRGVFADQVGLGKTVQALLAAHIMFLTGEISNCVIVAPANLLPQWRKEVTTKFAGVFEFIEEEGNKEMNFSILKTSLHQTDGTYYHKPIIYFLSLEALRHNVAQENIFRGQIEDLEDKLAKCEAIIAAEMGNDAGKSEEQKDYERLATFMNTETKSMRKITQSVISQMEKKNDILEKIEKIKSASILYQKIDLLMVDEAHAPAKNPEQSALLQRLNKTYCILISATPIRENIDDIYNLIKIVDANRFPTIEKFYNFCGATSISELIGQDGNFEKVSKLNGLINSLFTRKRLYDPLVLRSFQLKSDELRPFISALSQKDDVAVEKLEKFERFKDLRPNVIKEKIIEIRKFIDISAGIIQRKAEFPERPNLLKAFFESHSENDDMISEITVKYISRGLMEYYKATKDTVVLDYLDWTRPPKTGECFLVKDKEEAFKKLEKLFHPNNRDNKTKVLIFAKAVADRGQIKDIFNRIDSERKVFVDTSKDVKTANMDEFKTFSEGNYDSIYLIDKTRKEGADFNTASRLVLFQMDSPGLFNLIEPLEMEQLIGRISRVGQKEKCRIYVFAYSALEQELFNIYNDPDGLDLFGKCSTEIDFVVPIIVEYFNKKFQNEEEFINLKKNKTKSFVDLFTYAYNQGEESLEAFRKDIQKICQQFVTDLKSEGDEFDE